MASSGPNEPNTVTQLGDGHNGNVYTNPSNMTGDDGSYASTPLNNSNLQWAERIKVTNCGFSIPSDATIQGVKIEVNGYCTNYSNYSYFAPIKTGNVSGSGIGVFMNPTEQWYSAGGATEMFGMTLTPAEVNSSDFGAWIWATFYQTGDNSNTTYLDAVRVTVYYALPSSPRIVFVQQAVKRASTY